MTRCRQAWFPTMVALMLLASGCEAEDVCADVDAAAFAYPDVGGPCCDEGLFYCWTPTYQCCGGEWISYYDGPCGGYRPDAGPPDCTAQPTTPGCPCTDGSAPLYPSFQPRVECVGGVWTSSTTHARCN